MLNCRMIETNKRYVCQSTLVNNPSHPPTIGDNISKKLEADVQNVHSIEVTQITSDNTE
jgi:hypothetical protein